MAYLNPHAYTESVETIVRQELELWVPNHTQNTYIPPTLAYQTFKSLLPLLGYSFSLKKKAWLPQHDQTD